MTLWDLILALFRRWPIVLAGAMITGVCGLLSIQNEGVYLTRTQVILLAPSDWYLNKLQESPWAVTKATGVVVKRVVGDGKVIKYGSPDASIVGISTAREAVWIRQEDDGGQWSIGFDSPVILVDVMAPTAERTRALQQAAVHKIASALSQLQDGWGVDPRDQITSTVAPASAAIHHVTGSKIRALAMTTVVGAGLTLGAVLTLEYRLRRRTARFNVSTDEAEFVLLDPATAGTD